MASTGRLSGDVGDIAPLGAPARVQTRGKHLWLDGAPHRVHGVTYGSFAHRNDGAGFPETAAIARDFAEMRRLGIDTVRTYELPPLDLVDEAAACGLRILVGLHYDDWRIEAGTSRRDQRRVLDAGLRAIDEALEVVTGRPEVLAVAVGNEIPVDLVRLHGRAHIERTLGKMVDRLHDGDPELLVSYVNFPTTEFLEIPGLDFSSFNVFLEDPAKFGRYLDHLQVVSRDRPLVITELGLAADIHGEEQQERVVQAQLGILDEFGTAGGFVFSWTDDWVVAGEPVTGWGFGLTDADRNLKRTCHAVSRWSNRTYPKELRDEWPRVSVVVCAFNEEATIGPCVDSVLASTYPDLELIVCNDGSTDTTASIVAERGVKTLDLDHGGLSRARNAGLEAATGDIIAYLDADAACHPDWPFHLVLSLESGPAATGGPNLPFSDAGLVERSLAHVAGQASEVLLGPGRAEHVPGCNMAFLRDRLVEIGGFDVRYVAAGDDVDVCWKLLDRGHAIGFSAAAQVDHHRRSSVRGFLRQQRGYGRAERMLAGPHRHRMNRLGQARWGGFLYGPGALLPGLLRPTVYTGWTGSAPFQPAISHRAEGMGGVVRVTLPLVAMVGVVAGALGAVASPLFAVAAAALAWIVAVGISAAVSAPISHAEPAPWRARSIIGLLTVLAPMARTWGRLSATALPAAEPPADLWHGDRLTWIDSLARQLRTDQCDVRVGGSGDFWDLEVSDGGPAVARITTAIAWGWEPRWALRWRLRPMWVCILAAALGVGIAIGTLLAWAVSLGTPMIALASFVRTRRSVAEALASTTLGAGETIPRDSDT